MEFSKKKDGNRDTFNFSNIYLQNEGEISAFEVHKVDNDNSQEEVIWAMSNLETRDWDPGRVLVESDGEKEYQVCLKHNILSNRDYWL